MKSNVGCELVRVQVRQVQEAVRARVTGADRLHLQDFN